MIGNRPISSTPTSSGDGALVGVGQPPAVNPAANQGTLPNGPAVVVTGQQQGNIPSAGAGYPRGNTSNQSNRSKAAKGGLNLTLKTVESFIFTGLQTRILEVFETQSIWTTSTDKTKLLQKMFGNPASGASETKVKYPYTFLTLNTAAIAESRGSLKILNLYGLQTAVVVDDEKRAFRVKLLPVDFTIGVEFVTNNYDEVQRYVNTWLFARQQGWLRFNVLYGKSTISVAIEMDGTVQFPQREADLTNVQEYTVTSSLVVQGYMSFAVLQEQQIIDTVKMTDTLAAPQLPNNPPGVTWSSTTTWAF